MLTRRLKNRGLLLVLICALLLPALTGCGGAKTLKLADYMRCSLQTYDGFAALKERFDLDGLAEAVADAAGYSETKSGYEDKLDRIQEDLEDLLESRWSKTDHIAVGDKLTCRFDVEAEALKQKYNVILDTADYTHTVAPEELEPLTELSAEDLLKVTLSGFSGAGSIEIKNGSRELKDVTVSGAAQLGDTLSNGDVILLKLSLKSGADLTEYLGTKGYKAPADDTLRYTVSGLQEPQAIDPFAAVLLSYQGVNGYAALSYDFADGTPEAIRKLPFGITKVEDLSNGESVTMSLDPLSVHYCLREGYLLTASEKTFTVEGLEEPRELDPFAFLTVSFDGPSGAGVPVLETIEAPGFEETQRAIVIGADQLSGLSLGDEITCTVRYREKDNVIRTGDPVDPVDYCLRHFGVRLTKTEKTYTVDKIDRYVASYDEIPEDLRAAMLAAAEKIDWRNNWDEITLDKKEYLGRRFYFRPEYSSRQSNNEVYFLYRFTATHKEWGSFVFYNYVCFTDLLLQKDGTFVLDLGSYSISHQWCDPTGHMGWFGNAEGYETREDLWAASAPVWAEEYELEEELIAD